MSTDTREAMPDVWIRRNGEPYSSGVAHFGESCPPRWVGSAEPYVTLSRLRAALATQPAQPKELKRTWGTTFEDKPL